MRDQPKLEKASFEFSQEGNCLKDSDFVEILTIECESSLGIDNDEGCFYVLKTETGWSIDSLDEIQKLLDRVNKTINK